MKKIFRQIFVLTAMAALVAACGKDSKPENSGSTEPEKPAEETKPTLTISADNAFTDNAANVTLTLSEAASKNVTVALKLDESSTLADANLTFSKSASIKKGETKAQVEVKFDAKDLAAGDYTAVIALDNATYVNFTKGDKVSIKATVEQKQEPEPQPGGSAKLLALDDPNLYSNFLFEDKKVELTNFTYEVRFYSTQWNTGGVSNRLCAFDNNDESKSVCLRISDQASGSGKLQVIGTGLTGNWVVDPVFETNKWYTISVVCDGTNMTVYYNGDQVGQHALSAGTTMTFERFELGMSWDDGSNWPNQQKFYGYIGDTRVWSVARSASEIKASLCEVDPHSAGLEAYWKFDEGQGHIFKDATGKGRDMDWSKTFYIHNGGSGKPATAYDGSAAVEGKWTSVDFGRCN